MSEMNTELDNLKQALRITTDAFDTQLTNLMSAALADLGIAGVDGTQAVISDPLTRVAVHTYVQIHFGDPDNVDALVRSYHNQKAQLGMATGYTTWASEDDGWTGLM